VSPGKGTHCVKTVYAVRLEIPYVVDSGNNGNNELDFACS